MIMGAGLDHANKNYAKKYEELLTKGLEEKDDAVKSVLCTAMASEFYFFLLDFAGRMGYDTGTHIVRRTQPHCKICVQITFWSDRRWRG